ncbi:MAG: SpoIVB peptidase S55 domain-containing protein, partial [Acutalibacteraceae bacterium]
VQRDSKKFNCKITPQKSDADGLYKAGIWVRDSSAGLGTMTFYSPVDGSYAALGHAICDVDTGLTLPLQSGEIVGAKINSIVKSERGNAGELCGVFTGQSLGTLTVNNEKGLYGKLNSYNSSAKLTKIASSSEITTGKAKIITSIDNSGPKSYDCVIERVGNCGGHDMIIRITDKNLIESTGGIVQGMSGSPILQNGKLVGALTHVFVNDSTKGYAIFAQQMYLQMTEKSASVNK